MNLLSFDLVKYISFERICILDLFKIKNFYESYFIFIKRKIFCKLICKSCILVYYFYVNAMIVSFKFHIGVSSLSASIYIPPSESLIDSYIVISFVSLLLEFSMFIYVLGVLVYYLIIRRAPLNHFFPRSLLVLSVK